MVTAKLEAILPYEDDDDLGFDDIESDNGESSGDEAVEGLGGCEGGCAGGCEGRGI